MTFATFYWYSYNTIITYKGNKKMNKLRELRKARGFTQEDIAKYLDVSMVTVYSYEKGATGMSEDTLIKLSQLLNCTVDELLGVTPKRLVNTYPLESPIMLPVYGEIAAGAPISTNQSPTGEYIYEDKIYGDGNHIVLRVEGDSMYPDIVDGSYAIIRCQNYAQPNQIVAVCLDKEYATLKKYIPQVDGSAIFQPINPKYQPIMVTAKQFKTGDATIIGVLREVKRKF